MAVTPVLAALAACGDPDEDSASTDPTTPGTNVAAVVDHPTGADDVVLKLSYEGGLVPVGFAFVNTPSLLVSGDGRVFTPGAIPAIYPGPLLPTLTVRTIAEEGMQAVLGIVQDAGLLAAPPDYSDGHNIADASNTVLMINAGGGTFVHSAYALGLASTELGAETGARQRLLDAANKLSDALTTPGANEPDGQPFVPEVYRFQARAIDPAELTRQDPAPSVVDWPATSSMSLADATTCARLEAGAVGSLFLDAKQNTYFKDGDIVYQLAVAGVLPGDPAC